MQRVSVTWKVKLIPVADIGTDGAQANILPTRQVQVPKYLGVDPAPCAMASRAAWLAKPALPPPSGLHGAKDRGNLVRRAQNAPLPARPR